MSGAFRLPVFCPTALRLLALRQIRSFLFSKASVLPPRVLLTHDFVLNSPIPHILIEHLQNGQDIVLSTENKGDENTHVFMSKPSAFSQVLYYWDFRSYSFQMSKRKMLSFGEDCFVFLKFSQHVEWLHFSAVWEIYKHHLFSSPLGDSVLPLDFFSPSKSAKCINF